MPVRTPTGVLVGCVEMVEMGSDGMVVPYVVMGGVVGAVVITLVTGGVECAPELKLNTGAPLEIELKGESMKGAEPLNGGA